MTKEERMLQKQAEWDALPETQKLVRTQKKEIKMVLLFFSIFFAVSILLGYFLVQEYLDVQVAKTGTIGTAYVIDCDYHSGDEDSDDYYEITYEYEIDGVFYKGSYQSDWSKYRGDEITIKHNGGSRSVIATHSTSFILSAFPLLIVFVVFGIAEITWIVGMFIMSAKLRFYKKLDRGECFTTQATYVSGYTEGTVRGGKVTYMYEDENGNMHEGKSMKSYSVDKLKYFMNKGSFEIQYIGKYSVIMDKPETAESKKEEIIIAHGLYKCPYCGAILQEGQNVCPSCSAQRR